MTRFRIIRAPQDKYYLQEEGKYWGWNTVGETYGSWGGDFWKELEFDTPRDAKEYAAILLEERYKRVVQISKIGQLVEEFIL